jgi:hypothetical protein
VIVTEELPLAGQGVGMQVVGPVVIAKQAIVDGQIVRRA